MVTCQEVVEDNILLCPGVKIQTRSRWKSALAEACYGSAWFSGEVECRTDGWGVHMMARCCGQDLGSPGNCTEPPHCKAQLTESGVLTAIGVGLLVAFAVFAWCVYRYMAEEENVYDTDVFDRQKRKGCASWFPCCSSCWSSCCCCCGSGSSARSVGEGGGVELLSMPGHPHRDLEADGSFASAVDAWGPGAGMGGAKPTRSSGTAPQGGRRRPRLRSGEEGVEELGEEDWAGGVGSAKLAAAKLPQKKGALKKKGGLKKDAPEKKAVRARFRGDSGMDKVASDAVRPKTSVIEVFDMSWLWRRESHFARQEEAIQAANKKQELREKMRKQAIKEGVEMEPQSTSEEEEDSDIELHEDPSASSSGGPKLRDSRQTIIPGHQHLVVVTDRDWLTEEEKAEDARLREERAAEKAAAAAQQEELERKAKEAQRTLAEKMEALRKFG